MERAQGGHVAYRAVLLAAGLVVAGLAFRQLITLLLAVVMTIIVAIPLAAFATRLERWRVPRPLGVLLGLLLAGLALAGILFLVIPSFVDEVNHLIDALPGIVNDLRDKLHSGTGAGRGDFGDQVQRFVRHRVDDPGRLVGPVWSVGSSIGSVIGALVFIVITSVYIAARPQPLVAAVLRVIPPARRDVALRIMVRLRESWVGWLQGVVVDMLVSGTLLYLGLRLIGLDYAVVFAVLTALLVVIPYFGSLVGAVPPVLLGLTESPTKALIVLGVYVLVQQIESNVIMPLVMAQRVKLHPAAIAIGVVMVGGLFGIVGLFIAVPLISAAVILAEELWVRPIEDKAPPTAMPPPSEPPPRLARARAQSARIPAARGTNGGR
jgi:predicted PurR-regulated permease PerM